VPDPWNVFGHDGWSRPDVTPTWTMMLPKWERRPRPRRGRGVSIARRLGDQLGVAGRHGQGAVGGVADVHRAVLLGNQLASRTVGWESGRGDGDAFGQPAATRSDSHFVWGATIRSAVRSRPRRANGEQPDPVCYGMGSLANSTTASATGWSPAARVMP
jgi:hypothetical protein